MGSRSSDRGLLPTFDERVTSSSIPRSHGTELADAQHAGSDDSSSDGALQMSSSEMGKGRKPPPPQPSGGGNVFSSESKQRVFRVTTLADGDYDSIPLQRLKNVVGTDGWAGRLGLWLLVLLVIAIVVITTIYMHAKARYISARHVCAQIHTLDTSNNDVVDWLKMERSAPRVHAKHATMGNPSNSVHTTVTNNPRHPLKLSREGREPTGATMALNSAELLRLPVGLATTLDIQQLMQSQEFDDDVTPGHDSTFHRLKTLREALPVDLYQANSNKRVQIDLLRLLRVARRAKVVTEVPLAKGSGSLSTGWGAGREGFAELHVNRVRLRLIQQLKKFIECTRRHSQVPCAVYTDVMRYPHSASLLYWGKFSLLRFNGPGVLYWRNGLVAYNGTWSNGTMHGIGRLTDKYGTLVWSGPFRHGHPQWTLASLWHNYIFSK